MQKILYLGMPGSGKTTTLLNILEDALHTTPPHKIAYVSFTKKAIHEAQERAFQRLGITRQQMPFFKTLHALAFSALGLHKDDVINDKHMELLGKRMGYDFLDASCPFQPLSLYQLSRVKSVSFYETWEKTYLIHTKTYKEFIHIIKMYIDFKEKEGLFDFTDMIIQYNKTGHAFPVKVAMVDEAQDLSTIQWNMLERAFSGVDRLILAGDDDQCIYAWSGADRKRFLTFEGEKKILDTSYRCPRVVANFANKISARIKQRYVKDLKGTDKAGAVDVIHDLESQLEMLYNDQHWLILVRNRTDIDTYKRLFAYKGVPFSIDKKPYGAFKHLDAISGYQILQKNQRVGGATAKNIADCANIKGRIFRDEHTYTCSDIFETVRIPQDFKEKLVAIYPTHLVYYAEAMKKNLDLNNPKINLTTIHGSKGAECDHVILACDQSILTHKAMQHFPDSEHRVFYVGATRAKINLYLLQPTKKRHYAMPFLTEK